MKVEGERNYYLVEREGGGVTITRQRRTGGAARSLHIEASALRDVVAALAEARP